MDRIEHCISFIAGKACQQINQDAKRRLAPYGVTPAQYAVLKVLWEDDAQTAAGIGERLVMDSATMTGLIDRLGAAGFVERRPDASDRRVNRLHLTAEGRALQEPLDREMDEMNAAVFSRFSPADGRLLRDLLTRLGQPGSTAPRA